jgi:hypothetical protein
MDKSTRPFSKSLKAFPGKRMHKRSPGILHPTIAAVNSLCASGHRHLMDEKIFEYLCSCSAPKALHPTAVA